MSLFKDSVRQDVKRVFLNADEFSDRHRVNGKELICQVDSNTVDSLDGTVSNPLYGVFLNTINLYVDSNDMERPVEDQLVRLDDRIYVVRKVKEEMGVYVITLEENDS